MNETHICMHYSSIVAKMKVVFLGNHHEDVDV